MTSTKDTSNVSRVKTSGDILTVPFSTNKLRVSSFIPHHDLPKNVKQVYLAATSFRSATTKS